jgi:hypothetical protein
MGRIEMSEAYQGGCACGAIRYEISGDPVFQNHCRCRDCQKKSGTGHGSYLTFKRDGAKISGEAKLWDLLDDNGNEKTSAFCPTCGSPLYFTFKPNPDFIAVHAASLDDPSRFKPQAVTYGIRAYDWDPLDPKLAVFDTMPPR